MKKGKRKKLLIEWKEKDKNKETRKIKYEWVPLEPVSL